MQRVPRHTATTIRLEHVRLQEDGEVLQAAVSDFSATFGLATFKLRSHIMPSPVNQAPCCKLCTSSGTVPGACHTTHTIGHLGLKVKSSLRIFGAPKIMTFPQPAQVSFELCRMIHGTPNVRKRAELYIVKKQYKLTHGFSKPCTTPPSSSHAGAENGACYACLQCGTQHTQHKCKRPTFHLLWLYTSMPGSRNRARGRGPSCRAMHSPHQAEIGTTESVMAA